MSMHKKPLTELEREGLLLHGLDIGKPSQLSDCFRHGIKFALDSVNYNANLVPDQVATLERTIQALVVERDNTRYERDALAESIQAVVDAFTCGDDDDVMQAVGRLVDTKKLWKGETK